jgi:hypothetical protein
MKYRLRCEFCSESFVHQGDTFPDECPKCHAYVGLNGKPEVSLPAISLKANRSPDLMYRAMEEGSQHRVNMAAEITGQPASEFSALKQTNMLDNLRPGDISAPTVRPVNGMTGNFGGGVDPGLIANIRSEQDPRARGASQVPVINQLHRQHAQSIVGQGQIVHRGKT